MRVMLVFALAGAAVSACAPVVRQHGYVDVVTETEPVQVAVDTKETVESRMGSPSTTGVFDDTWYYISSVREDFAYLRPLVTDQHVMAIRFDEDGKVSSVEEYTVEDSNRVSLVSRETPTRGKRMGFLEQIFGGIGTVSSQQLPGAIDTLPESAGGPNPY